ncbi:MAG: tetratricopeptide repeat protein [Bacteroidota bacterium]
MKKIITAILFATVSMVLNAQDFAAQKKAFSDSYGLEASKLYDRASEVLKLVYSETNYDVNLRLGWLNYMAGKYTDAIGYYQKAIAIAPNSIEARMGIVYPLSVIPKWEDVTKQYLEILKIDPKNATVNYRIALLYYNTKDYANAKKYLDAFLQSYPFDFDALSLAGWNSLKLNQKADAKDFFQKALLNRPEDKATLNGLELAK